MGRGGAAVLHVVREVGPDRLTDLVELLILLAVLLILALGLDHACQALVLPCLKILLERSDLRLDWVHVNLHFLQLLALPVQVVHRVVQLSREQVDLPLPLHQVVLQELNRRSQVDDQLRLVALLDLDFVGQLMQHIVVFVGLLQKGRQI